MKVIFLLSFLISHATLFARKGLCIERSTLIFQCDTIPNKLTKLDSFYCGTVETEACIDSTIWYSYIFSRINHITDSIGTEIPAGIYQVQVIFLIEKNGSISNVKVLNNPGFCFSKLAEQIIQHGPRWEPSTRNGKFTRTYKKENITFAIPFKNKCDTLTNSKLISQ